MTSWTNIDLGRIGAADELQLTSFKEDGTLRKLVTIWVVGRTHLAFYAGWPKAMSAITVAKQVFEG